jgi:hypothetical protein
MSNSTATPPQPNTAQSIIEQASQMSGCTKKVDREFIHEKLPLFLETAIGYILADFDYENNQTADTAIGLRILALIIDYLNDPAFSMEGEL